MMETPSLSSIFLARAGLPAMRAEDESELEGRLAEIADAAVAKWASVPIDRASFVAYLAEHVREEPDPRAALSTVHTSDLFLAWACARHDPAALRSFESEFFGDIEPTLKRLCREAVRVHEVEQTLRAKLFVGTAEAPPKITEYSGRGDLKNWFRVAAVRQALTEIRKVSREVSLEGTREGMAHAALPANTDPELAYLRAKYEHEFQSAFEGATRALSDHERNLLRHHYIDGLNIDQIGAIYRFHRMTAARQLTAVRQKLVDHTRQHLAEHLHLSETELRSVFRLIKSQFDLSLRRVLGTHEPAKSRAGGEE